MNPKVCLITGANRGIGLEFVKQLLRLADPPKLIFAGCRNPDQAQDLQKLAEANSSLKVVKVDLNDLGGVEKLRDEVEALCGDLGLNLLINNAGVFPKDSLEQLTEESLNETIRVNTIAPIILTKTFVPLLRRGAAASPNGPVMSCSKAAIVNITSILGSIELGNKALFDAVAPCYSYRIAKVGLNMFAANIAHDLRSDKILVANLHPGWVRTAIGLDAIPDNLKSKDPAELGLISAEESVSGMMKVLDKINEKDTGCYVENTGNALPW